MSLFLPAPHQFRALMVVVAVACSAPHRPLKAEEPDLVIPLRSLTAAANDSPKSDPVPVEKTVRWKPRQTALVICDMWDDHWCRSAAARVSELAGPLDRMVRDARTRGVFIIHAPSSVTAHYRNTPERQLAVSAPFAKSPVPLSTAERWGTTWCWPDPDREPAMPVDDSDMGCDCAEKCTIREAWKSQHPAIAILPGDAISDHGQEVFNLLAERKIEHVILCGVHLNMCVLGRPFGIRQMVKVGKDVALLRDMTDTMYDPRRAPHVSHFKGTDLVIGHVERYWCPTFTSTALTGRPPFEFRQNPGPPVK